MERKFELVAKSDVLPSFRKTMREFLECRGWCKKTTAEILLAIDEVLTNIIRHAYQGRLAKMTVWIEDDEEKIKITIEDHGVRFNPTEVSSPKLPPDKPGGLGVHFIRTVMDEMVYDADYKQGNRLYLIKRKSKI